MKMYKYVLFVLAMLSSNVFAASANSSTAANGTAIATTNGSMNDACSITCYEKTPTCYVTQDKDGCLVISDKKPACNDGKCVCEIPSCEVKRVIKLK